MGVGVQGRQWGWEDTLPPCQAHMHRDLPPRGRRDLWLEATVPAAQPGPPQPPNPAEATLRFPSPNFRGQCVSLRPGSSL